MAMAMYYIQRVSLFLGLFCMASLVRCVHQAKNESLGPRVPVHGNWCGPSHGGFQDCCYGGPCPSCIAPEPGQLDYRFSQECFNECPPIDWVDLACAWHDTCTYVAGEVNGCGHFIAAESCYCNCVLADIACNYIADGVCTYFRDIASCWFCDNDAYYPAGHLLLELLWHVRARRKGLEGDQTCTDQQQELKEDGNCYGGYGTIKLQTTISFVSLPHDPC
ncbi:Disintegrin domain-containing protein [Balamuthia mandrillaris]